MEKVFNFSEGWYYFLIAAVVCYFAGCFNFAVIISRLKKKDIRDMGSGNPGTLNMTRSLGLKFGALNFLCDVAKGGVPVLVAYFLFKNYTFGNSGIAVSDFARYFFGIFVIIGHIFPVTMKFKGGKGIASTMGIFVFALPCEQWWYIFVCLGVLCIVLGYIILTALGSMGSLMGVAAFTVIQAAILVVRYSDNLCNVWVILMLMLLLGLNLLTWVAHHKNINRLLAGEEHPTKAKKSHK